MTDPAPSEEALLLHPAQIAAERCPSDILEYGQRNNLPEFARATWEAGFIDGYRFAAHRLTTALLNPSEDEDWAIGRCIRKGCSAADVHPQCSFPECSCKQLPRAIRAALRTAAMKITGHE